MKLKWLLLTVPFVFLYCAGNPESFGRIESKSDLQDVKIEEIEKKLNSSDTLTSAIQDISFLKRRDFGISGIILDDLQRQAEKNLYNNFQEAVESEDFKNAKRIYRSGKAMKLESFNSEWSDEKLDLEIAKQYLEREQYIPGILLFKDLISSEIVTEDDLFLFADSAYKVSNKSILQDIVKSMIFKNIEVPREYMDFLSEKKNPADMLTGTVTIWVNKGIKIESGIGYPDRVIGSGFFIDPRGFILTNYHVIESEVDPEYEGYSRLYIRLSDSVEDKHPAKVVGYDRIFDIALLKVEMDAPYVFSIDENEEYQPGETIYAIGSPGGLQNTITSGIISAVERRFLQMGDAMQVDVPINPGNSGGPLLNEDGQILGVVFAGIEQFEGINFAIPFLWVIDILPQLFEGNEIVHPWLGMAVHEDDKNLEVMYTVPGESADMGGIGTGDLLLEINGKKISTIRDVQEYLISETPDTVVELSWEHDDKVFSGYFSLTERPYYPLDTAIKRDRRDNLFIPLFGMEIEETHAFILDKSYSVKRVYRGSIADETGISVNDPLKVRNWKIDDESRIAFLQIFVKKRKSGFMESVIQLANYLEMDNFI